MTATIRKKIQKARARSLDWMRATGSGDASYLCSDDVVQRRRVLRELKRLELESPVDGWPRRSRRLITVPDGVEELTVELRVQEYGITEIARRAGANKTGVSQYGPIRVKVLGRKRLS